MIHGICSTYTRKKPHSTNHGASPVPSELGLLESRSICTVHISQWLLRSFPEQLGRIKEILCSPMSSAQEKNINNSVHAGATYMQGNLPVPSELLTVLSYNERHFKEKSYRHAGAYRYA